MTVKVMIGGDFFPGAVGDGYPAAEQVWGGALDMLRGADVTIVNLEAPVTGRGRPIRKDGPNLRLDPAAIGLLQGAGVDVAAMANNHILDHGAGGVLDTIAACRGAGIATVGAGADLEQARSTLYVDTPAGRLAVVNFAENEWASAGRVSAGAHPMDPVDNAGQIRQAAAEAEQVLVIVHGGHEHFRYPSPRIRKLYRFYAELGATAVVSHHTHCPGGWEVHEGVPIFYGLGNLLFPGRGKYERWYRGLLLEMRLGADGGPSFELHPYRQCHGRSLQLEMLEGDARQAALEEVAEISEAILDDQRLQEIWEAYVASQGHRLAAVTLRSRILQILLYKLGRRPRWLLGEGRLVRMLNQFRCESHRDVMIEAITRYLEEDSK